LKKNFSFDGPYYSEDGPYYSEYREDKWIVENLPYPSIGTFVDVGAANGIRGSNTYFFERAGWHGLCIEADPRQSNFLKSHRKQVELCAVSNHTGEITYYIHNFDPTWSGLICQGKGYTEIKTQSRKLGDLLKKHNINRIDLLSIDVEGSEIDVWRSFDVGIYQPEVLIIEYSNSRSNCSESHIVSIITQSSYELVNVTPANLIFARQPLGWGAKD
jgi:FkbM family methyltransferase